MIAQADDRHGGGNRYEAALPHHFTPPNVAAVHAA